MSPALITGAIFSFMWRWDDFMSALLYIDDPYKYPVSLALKLFCDPGSSSDYGGNVRYGYFVHYSIVLIFIFFQKYLADGLRYIRLERIISYYEKLGTGVAGLSAQ